MGILSKLSKTKPSSDKKEKKPAENKPSVALAAPISAAASSEKKGSFRAYRFLVKPIISEKAMNLKGDLNKYVFEVALSANKVEVAKAVAELYDVKVEKVNIVRVRGKRVRYGRRSGSTKAWKKAIVTLAPGNRIELVEGV